MNTKKETSKRTIHDHDRHAFSHRVCADDVRIQHTDYAVLYQTGLFRTSGTDRFLCNGTVERNRHLPDQEPLASSDEFHRRSRRIVQLHLRSNVCHSGGTFYKKRKGRKSALIGSLVGAVLMSVVSVASNYFIVYPVYTAFMPMEAIINAYQVILPQADTLFKVSGNFQYAVYLCKRNDERADYIFSL